VVEGVQQIHHLFVTPIGVDGLLIDRDLALAARSFGIESLGV
jgi:hypothetical protein